MLNITGFRIYKLASGTQSGYVVENGRVDYQPVVKYRINKKNAFDPTIRIRRGKYNQDSIDCEAILDANQYNDLLAILTDADQLYIEFDGADSTMQFPVTVDKLPKIEDDNRSNPGIVKFSLESVYTTLSTIDFNNVFGWGDSWGSNYGF